MDFRQTSEQQALVDLSDQQGWEVFAPRNTL